MAPAALVSTALPSPPSTLLPLGSGLINFHSFSRMWASGSHVVSPPHLYRLLLVGGPRASHEAPSVEEGWWAPSSGPLPGVFSTLPFAAWLCSTRWSLCHHGWRGSWAGPGDESAEPASVGGIAAALHWHPPRPSYVSSFCALGRRWGGTGENQLPRQMHNLPVRLESLSSILPGNCPLSSSSNFWFFPPSPEEQGPVVFGPFWEGPHLQLVLLK